MLPYIKKMPMEIMFMVRAATQVIKDAVKKLSTNNKKRLFSRYP